MRVVKAIEERPKDGHLDGNLKGGKIVDEQETVIMPMERDQEVWHETIF